MENLLGQMWAGQVTSTLNSTRQMLTCVHPSVTGNATDPGTSTYQQQGIQHEPNAELVLCIASMPNMLDHTIW